MLDVLDGKCEICAYVMEGPAKVRVLEWLYILMVTTVLCLDLFRH